jgi:hypothetical protein
MAAGGVACTGCTGEDYVVPGQNALVLETADPWEFVTLFRELRAHPVRDQALRRAGRATAERYTWAHIVRRLLLPRLRVMTEPLRSGSWSAREEVTVSDDERWEAPSGSAFGRARSRVMRRAAASTGPPVTGRTSWPADGREACMPQAGFVT